jgi:outer membrane protein assembly factor BamA
LSFRFILILFFSLNNLCALKADWVSDFISKKENDTVKIFIDRIVIFGNEVTKDEVIRREMGTKENSILDIETLKEDIERLYNLGLFTKIDVMPLPVGDNKFNIVITVEESFYLIPIPILNIKESDFSKIQVGANVLWRNFSGMNQTLGLSFALGYEPFVNLYYFNPWLGKKSHFFTSLNLSYYKTVNKSISFGNNSNEIQNKSDIAKYDNLNFKAEFSLGKYYSKYFSVSSLIGYNSLTVSEYQSGRTVSSSGKDEFLMLSFNLNFDKRDNIFYTTYGSYFNAKYIRYNSFNNEIGFNKFSLDLRKFVPVKMAKDYYITLASRELYSMPFGGNVPTYLNEVIGFDNLVRGWNGKVMNGEYIFCSFSEIRIPVLKPFFVEGKNHLIINKLPVFKDLSYKYGFFITPFFDIGAVWNRSDNFGKTQFRSGYGLGIDAMFPFNIVGRLDFALRNQNSKFYSQFIFFLNASF